MKNRIFDSVAISLLIISVNGEHSKKGILVHKKYKSKNAAFYVLDDSLDIKNTVTLYKFCIQYPKFSKDTKMILYEKIIREQYYWEQSDY